MGKKDGRIQREGLFSQSLVTSAPTGEEGFKWIEHSF